MEAVVFSLDVLVMVLAAWWSARNRGKAVPRGLFRFRVDARRHHA